MREEIKQYLWKPLLIGGGGGGGGGGLGSVNVEGPGPSNDIRKIKTFI